jgi:uncharacterized protein HemX
MKLVEALVLLVAGGLFVWWQLRDVRLAQEATKRQREQERKKATEASVADSATEKTGEPR